MCLLSQSNSSRIPLTLLLRLARGAFAAPKRLSRFLNRASHTLFACCSGFGGCGAFGGGAMMFRNGHDNMSGAPPVAEGAAHRCGAQALPPRSLPLDPPPYVHLLP